MKYFLNLFLACFFYCPIHAQTISPNTANSDYSIRDKLVELALQNPQLEIADHQINVAKYQLKEAKGWWANNITAAFNANEFTVKRLAGEHQPDGQAYPYFPLYNFGLQIPIGGIFSKPAATKAARERVAIAQAQRTNAFNQIKAAVLSSYEDYLAAKQLLTLQSQVTESAYNEFLQAKEKFRNGNIVLEDYNKATQQYQSQVVAKINAQHNFNLTKIQLEALIGVPLEKVLQNEGPAPSADSTQTP